MLQEFFLKSYLKKKKKPKQKTPLDLSPSPPPPPDFLIKKSTLTKQTNAICFVLSHSNFVFDQHGCINLDGFYFRLWISALLDRNIHVCRVFLIQVQITGLWIAISNICDCLLYISDDIYPFNIIIVMIYTPLPREAGWCQVGKIFYQAAASLPLYIIKVLLYRGSIYHHLYIKYFDRNSEACMCSDVLGVMTTGDYDWHCTLQNLITFLHIFAIHLLITHIDFLKY